MGGYVSCPQNGVGGMLASVRVVLYRHEGATRTYIGMADVFVSSRGGVHIDEGSQLLNRQVLIQPTKLLSSSLHPTSLLMLFLTWVIPKGLSIAESDCGRERSRS